MKERVLLHLIDYAKYAEALEVPAAITQEGIAREAGIDVPHFTQYVRPLIQEGLVREKTAHVKGVRRRRKAYDLTDRGKLSAYRLRDKLKSEVVRVRDEKGVREASVSQIIEEAAGRASILDVFRQVTETGIVDLATLAAVPPTTFIEMLAAAPQLKTFVGREAELEAVTRDGKGAKVFIIRGVAGIGKTSFAAKTCELLRGTRNLFWHRVRPWDTLQALLASLGDFLAALGRPGLRSTLSRGGLGSAPEILRLDLPGTSCFLVFDDAHEATPEAREFFRLLLEAMGGATDVQALVLTRQSLPFYDRRDVVLRGIVKEFDLGGLEPSEIANFLSVEREISTQLGRTLGGHPLFLELIRAQPSMLSGALSDIRRFLEEEVYAKLRDDERTMMKTASLYALPVPREALFARPGLSHDVLLSLSDRSLIRPVREARFEVHDTIRGFFADLLTPDERRELGAFAVDQLRKVAAQSSADPVASIAYLSNALQLSSPTERFSLLEALGEMNDRIGDLPAASTAYREAMKIASEPEALARLHRKLAFALANRGEVILAADEIQAGIRALGVTASVERGWLELLRCRNAVSNFDPGEAREYGEEALRIFESFADRRGQSRALLALGDVAVQGGPSPGEAKNVAEQYFEAALALGESLGDDEFVADVHISFAEFIGYQTGDFAQGMKHFAAVEALPGVLENPTFSARFFNVRAWFVFRSAGDFGTANADAEEALRIARQNHDAAAAAWAHYELGKVAKAQGQFEEARRALETSAAEFVAIGLAASGVDATSWAAESCLAVGDVDGFARLVAALDEPRLASGVARRPIRAGILRGILRLIRGDREGFQAAFSEAFRLLEGFPTESMFFVIEGWLIHFHYGVALRALGREREGEEHVRRAFEMLRVRNHKGMLLGRPEVERRVLETLRRSLKA